MATRRRNSVIFTPEDCLKWREPHLKPSTFHQWNRHRQEVWLLVHGIEDLTPLGWEYLRVQGGLSRCPQPISSTLLLRLLHRGKSRVQHLGLCSVNDFTLLEVLIAKAFHLVRGEVQYCRRLGWLHEGLYEPDQDDYQRMPLCSHSSVRGTSRVTPTSGMPSHAPGVMLRAGCRTDAYPHGRPSGVGTGHS